MKNPCRRAVLALCLGFLVSQVLSAQSDLGTISGFVKDPSGATVPNAKVTVQNQSGVDREAIESAALANGKTTDERDSFRNRIQSAHHEGP